MAVDAIYCEEANIFTIKASTLDQINTSTHNQATVNIRKVLTQEGGRTAL
jgi:hypothetical protein